MAELGAERGNNYICRRAHAVRLPAAKSAKIPLKYAAAMQEAKVPRNRAHAPNTQPPAAKAATCSEKVENVVRPPHSPTRWNFPSFGRGLLSKSA